MNRQNEFENSGAFRCSGCGARIEAGMKICPNCGKIAASQQPRTARPQPAKQVHKQTAHREEPPKQVHKQTVHKEEPPKRKAAEQCYAPISEPAKKKKRSKLKIVLKAAKMILIILIVYAVIFAAQVFRIRHSDYEFKSKMKMSQDNFGEALDNYFEDGRWSYDPITFTASYKGTHEKQEYEITFSALVSVKVKSITIDGEKVKSKFIETEIMGMFI